MIGRLTLALRRPIKPVIRLGHKGSKLGRRRGLALVWRRLPRRPPPLLAGRPLPSNWALTFNLFFKAIAESREPALLYEKQGRGRGRRPPRELSRTALVWPAPRSSQIGHHLHSWRSIIRRLMAPVTAQAEPFGNAVVDVVKASPTPLRARTNLDSLPDLTWPSSWSRAARHLSVARSNADWNTQPAAVPARERRIALADQGGSPRPKPAVAAASLPSARPARRVIHAVVPISPHIRSRRTIVGASSRADSPVPNVPALVWQSRMAPPPAMNGPPETRHSAVELVWPSQRSEPLATGATTNSIVPSPAVTLGSGSSDIVSIQSGAAQAQAIPPDVDRLIDEVFRRMDRQFRCERLRRGL